MSSSPGRCRCIFASKVAVGSFVAGWPWSLSGVKPAFSVPLLRFTACTTYAAWPGGSYVLATTYAVFVAESIAGVDVMPIEGWMELQGGPGLAWFRAGPAL